MTDSNLQRHRNSVYYSFWKQLQPGYAQFVQNRLPPSVSVNEGHYVLNQPGSLISTPVSGSALALTEAK
jgi:murein L,D-transpeptidase YafK